MGVSSASPFRRAALLLLLVVLVAEGRELKAVPATLAPSFWSSCQQTVCSRVRDEAEGLARLKLLRGYVTETVKLLDSLMDSMDSELVEIAKEMKEFVGPRCDAAHQLLAQVSEAMPRRNLDLSAGIMEEATAQRVVDSQTSGREELDDDIEQRGYDSDSQGWARPGPGSGGSSHGTGRELSGGQQQSSFSSGQQQSSFSSRKGIDERSSSTSSSLGRGIENNANSVYSEENTQEDTRDGQAVWRTGPGAERQQLGTRGQGRQLEQGTTGGTQHRGNAGGGGVSKGGSQRHDSTEETHQTSGSNQYNSVLVPTSNSGSRPVGGGNSWRAVPTGPNCRGRRGSPYAVPGIDVWCVQNCAAGYCPQTHCICE